MPYYKKELLALKKANRYRKRTLYNSTLKDFASNDYLGLAHNQLLHQKAVEKLDNYTIYGAKASMLVNGYHKIHQDTEQLLAQTNGFEDAILLGSGFNANIALIESLVRKKDILFIDELYHASGVLATQLQGKEVYFFRHNDMQHLKELLATHKTTKRRLIAVEGIYSMEGDLCDKEVFEIAKKEDAILIVDEAHSSGVVGENLLGVFDLYNINVEPNHIKMGTLGKAYGGFGAYVLASSHIIEYMLNRAKPVIYATAPSLYESAKAQAALEYILENKTQLSLAIKQRQKLVKEIFNIEIAGLIVPIVIANNAKVLHIQQKLQEQNYSIGAIRQPTVPEAIIRIIARVGEDVKEFETLLKTINTLL